MTALGRIAGAIAVVGALVLAADLQPAWADQRDDFLAGTLLPSDCKVERSVLYPEDRSGIDTAVYRFPMAQYLVGQTPDGRVMVTHIPANGAVNALGPQNEGTDILLNATSNVYADTQDEKFAPPETLRRMVRAGDLGRKSGRGFYDHSGS